MAKGVFEEHYRVKVAFGKEPSVGDMMWVDQTTGLVYSYDTTRSAWISTAKHMFEFARKGATDGMYIPLLGDLNDSGDVYMSGKSAIIVNVFCRSRSGNESKGFEIRKNGDLLYEFYYNGSGDRVFSSDGLNYNIEAYDMIQVYVKKAGEKVNDTVCRIETVWRYDL